MAVVLLRWDKLLRYGSDIRLDISILLSQASQTNVLILLNSSTLGYIPKTYSAICVKNSVHCRAAFALICDCIINLVTYGVLPCELSKVVFTNLAKEVVAFFE